MVKCLSFVNCNFCIVYPDYCNKVVPSTMGEFLLCTYSPTLLTLRRISVPFTCDTYSLVTCFHGNAFQSCHVIPSCCLDNVPGNKKKYTQLSIYINVSIYQKNTCFLLPLNFIYLFFISFSQKCNYILQTKIYSTNI